MTHRLKLPALSSIRFLPALVALALPVTAAALATDKDQPADIQARSVDADERANIAIYQGNVRYVQGTRYIESDYLKVTMKDDEVEHAKATGRPVKLRIRPDNSPHDAHAAGERLEYRRAGDEMELFDAVTLQHQPADKDVETRATADRLLYRGGEDIAELFGRVIVQQGGDVVSGGYAHVNLKTDRVIVRGGPHTDERIYAVMQPRKKSGDSRDGGGRAVSGDGMDAGGRATPGAVAGTAAEEPKP